MTILVTGGTGNVGRQVINQLLAAGAKVRAMTRNPAAANLPEGVEVMQGDLEQPDCDTGSFRASRRAAREGP